MIILTIHNYYNNKNKLYLVRIFFTNTRVGTKKALPEERAPFDSEVWEEPQCGY